MPPAPEPEPEPEDKFRQLTRWGDLDQVMRGLDAAQHVERGDLNGILRRSRRIEIVSVCGEVQRSAAHPGEDAGHTPAA